jgi:exosortase
MFQGFSLILSLAGLVLLVVGPALFPVFVFPLAYLGFAVTISEMIMLRVTWGLKLAASQGAWALLNIVGIDTDLKGNNLEVYHNGVMTPLNVADACSGMRMVVAFIALAAAVGFLSCRRWWQRIAVILLSIPVAVAMNVARVAVLGGATLFNTNLASGGAHTLIGTLLLVPAFFIFMGCVWLLQKADPAPAAAMVGTKKKGGGS